LDSLPIYNLFPFIGLRPQIANPTWNGLFQQQTLAYIQGKLSKNNENSEKKQKMIKEKNKILSKRDSAFCTKFDPLNNLFKRRASYYFMCIL